MKVSPDRIRERIKVQHRIRTRSLRVERELERQLAEAEDRIGQARVMRAEGKGYQEIGKTLGLSRQTVHRILGRKDRKGPGNGNAKLTEDKVREIRSQQGEKTSVQLGYRYHVTATTILDIWHRRTWKHVE